MKKQSFFNGVLILLVGSVIAKALGAVYRIPLTWVLGVEGLGIYQLVFPIFSLILVLSSTGMPAGISKMIAKRKNNDAEINRILKISVLSLSVIGLVFGLILFLGAGWIAQLQGNALATLPYIAIAPAVVLVSVLSAFRGFFQGKLNMTPTSVSNILEQLFKLLFGLALAFILIPKGVEYGVLGAIFGITLSEIVAVGYMILSYLIERKKEKAEQKRAVSQITAVSPETEATQTNPIFEENSERQKISGLPVEVTGFNTESKGEDVNSYSKEIKEIKAKSEEKSAGVSSLNNWALLKELFKTSFPIVLATVILPFSLFIDSLLVVNLLTGSGWTVEQSTILWGIDTGIVTSIINLPVVLTLSVATAIIPSLVSDVEKRQRRLRQSMLISCNIALPCALGVMVLAPQIVQFLFSSSLIEGVINETAIASQLLTFSSGLILLTAILQTQNASLQGLGYSNAPVLNMFLAFVVKTVLLFVLVTQPALNIFGVAIAKYSFFIVAVGLNAIYTFRKTRFSLGVARELTVMTVASLTMAFSLVVFANFNFDLSPYILLPAEVMLGGVVYAGSFVCLMPDKNYMRFFRRKRAVAEESQIQV